MYRGLEPIDILIINTRGVHSLMAGWCEIEEGDCGEVIGGWNDATLYRWRVGLVLDRENEIDGKERKREGERKEGRTQGRAKERDGEKAGEIKRR